jgi:hypothetical protein
MKLEHFATKKDGKFTITQRKTFEEGLSLLPDGNYTVIVERRKKKRSNDQNSYYWLLIDMMVQGFRELGNRASKESVHNLMREEFCYEEAVNPKTGEIKRLVKSTTDLSTTEFMDYIEHMKQFSAEWLGVILPDPEDQLEIKIDNEA